MIDVLLALPSHLRKRLECALLDRSLSPPYRAAAVRAAVGTMTEIEEVVQVLEELDASGVSGPGCAALLRAMDRAASRHPTLDFVWSGPEVPGLHARDTRRVYEELLGSASRSAWVATYAFFDGPRAFEVLARRMDDTNTASSSTNLTGAALDHNIEVGLLVRDRTLAATVTTHFATLIGQSLLRRLPA